jgi:hypothetical protein
VAFGSTLATTSPVSKPYPSPANLRANFMPLPVSLVEKQARLSEIDISRPESYKHLLYQEGLSKNVGELKTQARALFIPSIPEEDLEKIITFLLKENAPDLPKSQILPIEQLIRRYSIIENERMPDRTVMLDVMKKLGLEHDLPERIKENIELWKRIQPYMNDEVYFSRKDGTVGCEDAIKARAKIPGQQHSELKSLYRCVNRNGEHQLVLLEMEPAQKITHDAKKALESSSLKEVPAGLTTQYDGACNFVSTVVEHLHPKGNQTKPPPLTMMVDDTLFHRLVGSVTNAGENTYSMHFNHRKAIKGLIEMLKKEAGKGIKILVQRF